MHTLEREPILRIHRALLAAVEQLSLSLHEHATSAIAHPLPTITDEEEVADHIPVKTLGSVKRLNRSVLNRVVASFAHFHRLPGQKITSVYRLPGVVVCARDLSKQIEQINRLKDELRDTTRQCYPRTFERSRALQQIFPSTHMNQLYRRLYFSPENTHRINLTWQAKSRADLWITPQSAIKQAEDAIRDELQRSEPNTDKITSLEIALKHFKGLPPAQELPSLKSLQSLSPPPLAYQLLQRSMVRPHPRAQLFELPKGSRAFATHPANLPLIAYDPDKTLDVRPLGDYQAERFAPRSDTKSGFESVCDTLSIYGGVPTPTMAIRRVKLRLASTT